jgi:hypothetical protein
METNDKGVRVSLNSIKSLFCDSFAFYQERFETLSEIVLLPTLVMLLGYVLEYLGSPFSIVGVLCLLVGVIILVFSTLALIFSIHNNTGVDTSYKAITRLFWPYVWIGILSFVALLGGMVMLIIPAIWLSFALVLRSYTLVIENRRGLDALRQSKDYIKGYWWAVLGRTILLLILFGIVEVVLQIPFSLIAGTLGRSIASMAASLLIIPFSSVFYYKIYENLRTLKPQLHEAAHSSGKFLKVSSIIGLVVAILLLAGAAVGIGYIIKHPDVLNNYPTSNQY